jgi:hypothetical protein
LETGQACIRHERGRHFCLGKRSLKESAAAEDIELMSGRNTELYAGGIPLRKQSFSKKTTNSPTSLVA